MKRALLCHSAPSPLISHSTFPCIHPVQYGEWDSPNNGRLALSICRALSSSLTGKRARGSERRRERQTLSICYAISPSRTSERVWESERRRGARAVRALSRMRPLDKRAEKGGGGERAYNMKRVYCRRRCARFYNDEDTSGNGQTLSSRPALSSAREA